MLKKVGRSFIEGVVMAIATLNDKASSLLIILSRKPGTTGKDALLDPYQQIALAFTEQCAKLGTDLIEMVKVDGNIRDVWRFQNLLQEHRLQLMNAISGLELLQPGTKPEVLVDDPVIDCCPACGGLLNYIKVAPNGGCLDEPADAKVCKDSNCGWSDKPPLRLDAELSEAAKI
jgi:hypothetical protein